mgnify:FL=1
MNGKQKFKKKVKGLFGKQYFTDIATEQGENSEITLSKNRVKVKGNKGKKIYKGKDAKEIKGLFSKVKMKHGGMLKQYD